MHKNNVILFDFEKQPNIPNFPLTNPKSYIKLLIRLACLGYIHVVWCLIEAFWHQNISNTSNDCEILMKIIIHNYNMFIHLQLNEWKMFYNILIECSLTYINTGFNTHTFAPKLHKRGFILIDIHLWETDHPIIVMCWENLHVFHFLHLINQSETAPEADEPLSNNMTGIFDNMYCCRWKKTKLKM